jgi:predicted acyl esterase
MRPVVIALLGLLLLAAPATAESVPDGYAYSDEWFESFDGTQMHAGVFLPADHKPGERHPVLMTITPYASPNGGATAAGNLEGPVIRFPELFEQAKILDGRYAYVQADVRGFGGSGGCFQYYDENEFQDTKAIIEHVAGLDWSSGKVGLVGKSYDAAEEVLALGAKPKGLAAAVIQSPGLSAYTALWMNGVHYATGRYGTTSTYTADDVGPAQNFDTIGSPGYAAAMLSPATSLPGAPTCRTDAIVRQNTVADRSDPFWAGREPYFKARGADTPVLWSHGFFDANTKPVHQEIYDSLTGPKSAWFGHYTHVRGHEGGVGRRGFLEQSMRFFDEHLRGIKAPAVDPPVTVQEGNGAGAWRAESAWPPADRLSWTIPVRAGEYTDTMTGANAEDALWTVTPALPHAAHLAGEMVLRAQASTMAPGTQMVAHVYDLGEDGQAKLVNRGAIALPDAGDHDVEFKLYPSDWRFEPGHRIAFSLTAGDNGWFNPGVTQTPVTVAGGSLELPLLRHVRDAFLEGGLSDGNKAPVEMPALDEAVVPVEMPPAQTPFPVAAPATGEAPAFSAPAVTAPVVSAPPSQPGVRTTKKSTLKLRLRGKRLIATGTAPGARRIRLTLKLGRVTVTRKTVRVARGRFRTTFSLRGVRSGRLEVSAGALRRAVRLR